jgi:hypothetical protein
LSKLTTVLPIAVLATAAFMSPSPAHAQDDSAPFANPPPPAAAPMAAVGRSFGAAGQWVGSMRTSPGSGFVYFHNPSGAGWEISIHPAVDYFLAQRISIGGVFGYTYAPGTSGAAGTTTVDLGARAGFNLDITGAFGFWPTAGIAARVLRAERVTTTSSALQIFAPFLWHPAGHVFAGLGPSFNAGLSGGDYTEFGLDFIIGGWI